VETLKFHGWKAKSDKLRIVGHHERLWTLEVQSFFFLHLHLHLVILLAYKLCVLFFMGTVQQI
jgi:hypothetical protein